MFQVSSVFIRAIRGPYKLMSRIYDHFVYLQVILMVGCLRLCFGWQLEFQVADAVEEEDEEGFQGVGDEVAIP